MSEPLAPQGAPDLAEALARSQAHVAELEAMLQERGTELLIATSRLMEQEKLSSLGLLVAGFAHEVNTPVGLAITAASNMDDQTQSLLGLLSAERVSRSELQRQTEQLQQVARLVLSNLQRAAELTSSFKSFAIDQTSDAVLPIDVPEHIRSVVAAHRPMLRTKHVKVTIEAPEHVHAVMSVGSLSQIISNLLINAVTHAFEGIRDRQIRIAVNEQDQMLLLSLRDNGRGVDAQHRPQLFEPFFTTRRGNGGSGLGLHIVQQLCQGLGGQVELDEQDGPGLGFIIRLPLSQSV